MEALLKVKNLSIDIRRAEQYLNSVKDISFEIYPGEILGIVGESGSGKSLTALSIPGLLGENREVSAGSILFREGEEGSGYLNLLELPEKELQAIRGKEISMVFQEPFSSLNPLVKIGKQITETLEIHGEKNKARINEQVKQVLQELKLDNPEKLMKAYPHHLSGGMCQRVMIAIAIICRPRLLIADEITTALDQNTQTQIIAFIKKINRDFGTAVLFISHDLSLVRNFCDRVLVMYSGRLLEEGNAEDVFLHPAHEYSRNLLDAIPGRANRGKDLASIPGKIPSLEEGRPPGCPFHPRCSKASPLCVGEFPPLREIGANHKTHCVIPEGK